MAAHLPHEEKGHGAGACLSHKEPWQEQGEAGPGFLSPGSKA